MQLATNPRTAVKAQIKRASARARTLMNRLDAESLKQLDHTYRAAIADIQYYIHQHADSAGNVRLQIMQQLLDQAKHRLQLLADKQDQLLNDGFSQAAQLGAQPYAGTMPDVFITRAHDQAVQFMHTYIDKTDGLQLSDRLWRVNNHTQRAVSETLQQSIIQGHSASQAASNLLARGQTVPADIQNKINSAQSGAIASKVSGILTGEGNPRVNALRLARTELNRAHGEAYMAAGADHPDFGGWKFLLSPAHPAPDICDMHARVNRYGLGPGVYPSRERCPWPAHPNTKSYVEIVFKDEITAEDKAGKQDRIEWLNNQHPSIQSSVLNSQKKRAALVKGILKENEIATPWNVLKQKFIRKGVDVNSLTVSPAEPTAISGRGGAVTLIPKGAPVSAALEVKGQVDVSQHVLEVIDKTHGDGALPVIPIKNAPHNARYFGAYTHTVSGRSVSIEVRAGGSHRDLTLAHEIGHFIDHQGAPGAGFSSANSAKFANWRNAIEETAAVKQLRALREGPSIVKLPGGGTHHIDTAYLDYLLQYNEMWARSYAQWITTKSGDGILQKQLSALVGRDKSGAISYHRQWDDQDFAPVVTAIDNLMQELGWLK